MKKILKRVILLMLLLITVMTCGENSDKNKRIGNNIEKQNESENVIEKPKNPYLVEKGKVYYNGEVVKGAKAGTFGWIEGTWYGKDENNVYFEGKKVGKLEGKPIERINNYLVKSGNALYYFYWKIDNLKNSKMEIIANKEDGVEYYIKDGKNVYFLERNINFPEFDGKLILLRNIDYNTFEVINKKYFRYVKDKTGIYYVANGKADELKGLDKNTFKIIDFVFSADKNRVYYRGIKLEKILSNGFEVVGNVYDVSYYLKDRDKVYFLNEVSELSVVEKADSKTFSLIDDLYSKDKNNIFCDGKILEGADVKSFKVFYDSDVETAKDSKHGYDNCYSVR